MYEFLVCLMPQCKPMARPTEDGYYWIEGEAIIREKMWPYEHRQRVAFHNHRPEEQIPVLISNGLIDMGGDVSIPVEWVTAKSRFYGPIQFVPPWKQP